MTYEEALARFKDIVGNPSQPTEEDIQKAMDLVIDAMLFGPLRVPTNYFNSPVNGDDVE